VLPLKTTKRSLFAFGSLAAASALVLSGCAAAETPAPTETASETPTEATPAIATLTVWVDDMVAKSLEGVAAQFEADTGIAVELVIKDFGSIRDEAITAIPTGEGPDIIAGAHDWTGQLVAAGVVAPVELGAALGDFRENAIAAFSYDGALYGLPFGVENIALVCNVEAMPAQPATWEEVTAAGVEIAMGVDSGDPYHMYYIQTSFGAPVFNQNADGSYTSELGMGTEGGFEFAEWLATEGAATFAFKDYGTVEAEVKDGSQACWITGPWAAPGIAEALGEDGYAIYSLPSVGGETPVQFLGARGFYVSSQTQDPLYVNKFLAEYIGSEAAQTEIFEIGGRIPAHKAALEAASGNKIVQGFGAAGANAQPMPSIPEMGSVWASWGSTQAAIMQGKVDAREGWQKMLDEINAAIAG
jgi:arabinogalactan oligomer / maltooligosaccharide transport system substrate-binding protein